jgi:hypothetical protein
MAYNNGNNDLESLNTDTEEHEYEESILSNQSYNNNYGELDKSSIFAVRQYNKIINKKRKIIKYYPTVLTPGNVIRDAITGLHHRYHVFGSKSEQLYFKVAFTQGNNKFSQDGEILFYNTPSDYEKHMKVKLTDVAKTEWKFKYHKYLETLRKK